jgi:hypothetical protein
MAAVTRETILKMLLDEERFSKRSKYKPRQLSRFALHGKQLSKEFKGELRSVVDQGHHR